MPRVKITPRRVLNRLERETDNMDESILDDEEVERLEQELNSLRREKAKQIRKMRFKREERRKYGHSSYSSNESDTEQYSDQEDVEESGELDVTPRQSTRDLADGFEKAQKRFMFNIRHIEEKYRERELRGLPESKIEIDRHGRFYFPENMAACHQQAFVNRMFQYDSLFGKGSVSAPRNSIQSFDGDSRALKKSQQLDEKFGRKLRPSEVHNFHDNARKGRIVSSAHVSGIPLFVRYSSEDNDRRDTSQFSNDYDDDVFEPLPREHRAYNQKFPGLHGESMFSSHEKNSSEEEEMSDDEETTDDEEGITENEDETTDSSTETSDEEDEEEGSDKTTKSVKQEVVQQPTSRQNASEKTTPVGTKNTRTSPRESTTVSPQKVTMIVVKSEVVHQESLQREKQAPESTRLKETTPIIPQIPIKREISSVGPSTPRILRNIATSNTPSRNIIDGKCVTVANVEGLKIASTSETVNSKPEKPLPYSKGDIRKFMKPKPVQQDDSNSKPACDLAQSTHQLHEGSNALETLDVIILPTLASADRPKRTIKPTEKAVNLKKNSPDTSCSQSHETISKKRNSETKCQKQNRKSSPYCKHCKILAEEEKKELGSSDERLGHSKRRSDTAASGGPEKKKQKLVDSDLLSIPSSLAIVVDTDLIVTENPSLASSSIPKFSDKCPSPSRWSSNVDDKWIEDLKRVQSNAKVPQLLGVRVSEVPENVPLIKIWVDNLNRNKSDKDPFEKDIRRLVAQDKKARLDLKAGYDVRG
ncbi:hypothetical protein L5515_000520 [Caenorhabditis briggsae]|uniref:Uncharacterized protein n=1 Tax=Caenorhabditis briggsae TaxID=6238 RepID=A0AAE9J1K3_CAEBR|nr:hypothetical protein L5515_000520 [Caenorhabditis briggsae]